MMSPVFKYLLGVTVANMLMDSMYYAVSVKRYSAASFGRGFHIGVSGELPGRIKVANFYFSLLSWFWVALISASIVLMILLNDKRDDKPIT